MELIVNLMNSWFLSVYPLIHNFSVISFCSMSQYIAFAEYIANQAFFLYRKTLQSTTVSLRPKVEIQFSSQGVDRCSQALKQIHQHLIQQFFSLIRLSI